MKTLLLVAVGGSIGAVVRFKLSSWILTFNTDWTFPAGTFAVNILGCLISGILLGLAEKHDLFSEDAKLFLFIGLMGGFTTFSAFGLETVTLIRRGDTDVAVWYIGLSVLCGIAVLWGGLKLVFLASR